MTYLLQKKITDHQWTVSFVQDELMINRKMLAQEKQRPFPDPLEIQRLEYEIGLFEQGIDQHQTIIKKLQQDAQSQD